MTALRHSIIATLGFSGASNWPLTLMDVHERLVRSGSVRPTVAEVFSRLDALTAEGTVISGLGLYALADADAQTFAGRVEREKHCVQKWRRMRRYATWLTTVPYVRALLASGSLALGNTGPDSDWDAFVIAKAGRLYTARFFLLAASRCMGRLRTKQDSIAPDKFCFNHYVTTDGLQINHRSLYVAHALAMLVPIHDPGNVLGQLHQANRWTAQWVPATAGSVHQRRAVARWSALELIARLLERMLDTRVGDRLERRLAAWQQARIAREPATHERGGRVVASDTQLEFHPRSAEAVVLAAYNRMRIRHGLPSGAEQDSGLTK